jgi:hypothetical protein
MSEHSPLPETEQRQPKRSHDDEVSFAPFVLRVPPGDPFLARLIAVHGEDTIERTVRIGRKTAA